MKRLFIISILEFYNRKQLSSSSELFEYDLLNCLKKSFDVFVIPRNKFQQQSFGNIHFLSGPINVRKNLYTFISRQFSITSSDIFINFGYDYFTFKQLYKIKNKYNCKIATFVFDHHKPALQNLTCLKKILLTLYFNVGIKKINYFDKVILFNSLAQKKLKISTPFIVLKPFLINPLFNHQKKTVSKFLFAGTLNKYNCIYELITLFKNNPSLNLRICGTGPLQQDVIYASSNSPNIEYLGNLNNQELENLYDKTDCFVCFRKTDNLINSISFPSKIVEYARYDKPIFINLFSPELDKYCPFIWPTNSFIQEDLQKSLNSLLLYNFSENEFSYKSKRNKFINDFGEQLFSNKLTAFLKNE